MARPLKHSVDYFSHDNNMRNDKKLKAVRAKYGIMGYAIYVMILENLCEADMLFLDIDDDVEFEILSGDLGIESDKLREILGYLEKVKLLNIENGILFCKQLDRRVNPVFDKRKENLSSLRIGNPGFRSGNAQSKVKERKVKERKVKGELSASEKPTPSPGEIARKFFAGWDNPKLRGENFKHYADQLGDSLNAFCEHWTEPTKSGKKQLWETKDSFELSRRIKTWLRNDDKWSTKINGNWGKSFKPVVGEKTPDGRKIIAQVQGGFYKLEDGTFLAYRGTRWINVNGQGHAL